MLESWINKDRQLPEFIKKRLNYEYYEWLLLRIVERAIKDIEELNEDFVRKGNFTRKLFDLWTLLNYIFSGNMEAHCNDLGLDYRKFVRRYKTLIIQRKQEYEKHCDLARQRRRR